MSDPHGNIRITSVTVSVDKKFSADGKSFVSMRAEPADGNPWTVDEAKKAAMLVGAVVAKSNVKNAVIAGVLSKEGYVEEKERLGLFVDRLKEKVEKDVGGRSNE